MIIHEEGKVVIEKKEAVNPEDREELQQYKKLVFCKFYDCIWNVKIDGGVHIPHHKDWKPLSDGEADKYIGVCGRPALGLSKVEFEQGNRHEVVAKCDYRSDKGIKGHMDFSRLLQPDGSPYGGTISEPVGSGYV